MKICRITKNFPRGGGAPGFATHAYFLTLHIEEPCLVITKKNPAPPLPLPARAALAEIPYRNVPFSDYMENDAFAEGGKSLWQRLKVAVRAVMKMWEIIFMIKCIPRLVKFKPDIAHCHAFITILPGMFSKIFLKSKLVVTLHSSVDSFLLKRSGFLRRMLGFADRILCVSAEIRDDLLPFFPAEKFAVTPNGFDPSLFRNTGAPREKLLVAVGAFRWYKGYQHLARAMKIISEKHPDWSLTICGDGMDRPKIEEEIRQLGLEKFITITGMISQAEIAKILNRSGIFVMSSVVEGFPKALVEALACGAPAVITTACAAGDVARDTALTVPPEDPEALAEAVSRLISDPEQRRRLADACPAAVEKYDWSFIAADVKRIYETLAPA